MKSKLIITICDNLYVNYKVRQIMNARERNKRHTFEGRVVFTSAWLEIYRFLSLGFRRSFSSLTIAKVKNLNVGKAFVQNSSS